LTDMDHRNTQFIEKPGCMSCYLAEPSRVVFTELQPLERSLTFTKVVYK
jgi:hypothetical protein